MLYASAWLASREIGAVTLVDGVSAEVAATVPVAPEGTRFAVTQQGRAGFVTTESRGSLVRVDGATQARRSVDVPAGGLSETAGDDRYLWGLGRDGTVIRFADGTAAPRHFTTRAGPVDGPRHLVVTSAGPVVVSPATRRAYPLSAERGEVTHEMPVDIGPDDLVSGVPDRPWLLAVRPADSTLVRCEVQARTCGARIRLGTAGSTLGAAVSAHGAVFVPDRSAGVVWIVDLASGAGATTPVMSGRGTGFELSVSGGVVFFNDPDGPQAGVIAADGKVRRLVKYGGSALTPPVVPSTPATSPTSPRTSPPVSPTPPDRSPGPRPDPTAQTSRPASPHAPSTTPTPSPTQRRTPSPSPSRSPSPSPSPSPTPSNAPKNPYLPAHDRIVLDDPMTKNSGHWRNKSENTGTCTFAADGYHVASSGGNKYHECYGTKSVRDFTYEVEFSFGTARAAGLFFRQDGPGSWYWTEIGRSGTVWLSKGVDGVSADPDLFVGQVPAPDPDEWHTLAVTGVGTKLTVYVDGHRVGSITDRQFDSGPIGVFTDGGKAPDGTDPDGESLFRNVRVWAP
ncbi:MULTISPECIES: family 16 glycoside hydrolase [unclassified Micromonospora]|uniref:family 16 glycoside hydrolase n=1 Tax=unclassified Micromonospora TaxID=2617518 RepID=UPI003641FAD8